MLGEGDLAAEPLVLRRLGFQAVYSRIGYLNQSVWVKNRVSFFRKLISWLKRE